MQSLSITVTAASPRLAFCSPQTGNMYKPVYCEGDRLVAYRSLDDGCYRVRVQAPKAELARLKDALAGFHYGVTGDDHISRVVEAGDLPNVVGYAVAAVVRLAEAIGPILKVEAVEEVEEEE